MLQCKLHYGRFAALTRRLLVRMNILSANQKTIKEYDVHERTRDKHVPERNTRQSWSPRTLNY